MPKYLTILNILSIMAPETCFRGPFYIRIKKGSRIFGGLCSHGQQGRTRNGVIMMVSVIVPIYNTEAYLRECFHSIMIQSFDAIEVLMIDDGSTDRSPEICREFENTDRRFRYYRKENGGAGSARNYGIEKARGEYIAFVDSDDRIAEDYIEILYKMTEGGHYTIVQCGMTRVRDGKELKLTPQPGRYDSKGFAELILKREIHVFLLITTATKLYDRQFIMDHDLRFDEQVTISEDCLFNTQFLLILDSIALTDYAGYYYHQDHSTLSRTKKTFSVVEQAIKVGNLTSAIRNETIKKFDLADDPAVKWGFHTAICKIYISNAEEIEKGGFSWAEKKKLYHAYFSVMDYPVDAAIHDVRGINRQIVKASVKKRWRLIGIIYLLRGVKATMRAFPAQMKSFFASILFR